MYEESDPFPWGKVGLAVFVVAAAAVAYFLFLRRVVPPVAHPVEAVAPRPATAPDTGRSAAPVIEHPLAADAVPAGGLKADLAESIQVLLAGMSGGNLIQLDDFARRFVATVDNLGRSHAPTLVWPVMPTAGRFSVEVKDGSTIESGATERRYEAVIALAEHLDAERAADLYVRFYPEFQKAYEDLGFPKGYFNDRLVSVLDLLIATPQPLDHPALRQETIDGPYPSRRPWVHYQFEDPKLEALTSGQKIMIRLGVEREKRAKAVLARFRDALARREMSSNPDHLR